MGALPFCNWSSELPFPKPRESPESLTSLGDHVRARRLDLGLLQRDVAHLLGVTTETVWNWESHTNRPTHARVVARIIEFIGYCPLPPPPPGETIRYTRMIRGLSFQEAAAEIGLCPATLLTWERGGGGQNDARWKGK